MIERHIKKKSGDPKRKLNKKQEDWIKIHILSTLKAHFS